MYAHVCMADWGIINSDYKFQSFLTNEDIGDSLEGVEALITKHENFEKTLAAQEEKFKVAKTIWTFLLSL